MRGMYWEEWEVGAEFVSPARTVTETDIVNFACLSGDFNPLHINEEHCKQTQFGTRIAHGPLIYAIAAGLLFQLHLYDDTLIGQGSGEIIRRFFYDGARRKIFQYRIIILYRLVVFGLGAIILSEPEPHVYCQFGRRIIF